ncbi:hypothetical protein [Gimesia algae]|uniref:Uncharacterized protein n=1 Tax=Gimesia algae TaxID=2527971 RepID=A0A517V6E4_9PLAN|nr:hypothetical protein [Gimesia algae]QDT88582.1 hypothetical protein Pan161_02000 [Gimesia algae]
MKDYLSTISSIFVILFSLSVLFLADGPDVQSGEQKQTLTAPLNQIPQKKTMLFNKIQGVRVRDGVLIFVTLGRDGLKDHYYSLRGKHVILCKSPSSQMPFKSIEFQESSLNSLQITLSADLDIDLKESLKDF